MLLIRGILKLSAGWPCVTAKASTAWTEPSPGAGPHLLLSGGWTERAWCVCAAARLAAPGRKFLSSCQSSGEQGGTAEWTSSSLGLQNLGPECMHPEGRCSAIGLRKLFLSVGGAVSQIIDVLFEGIAIIIRFIHLAGGSFWFIKVLFLHYSELLASRT